MTGSAPTIRVGLLGWGAINRTVADRIAAARRDGDVSIEVTAVASRFSDGSTHPLAVPAASLGAACDVVVEAAGPEALAATAQGCLEAGADLVIVSVGALMNPCLRSRLATAGPGRAWLCAGAIGGLDLIEAARLYGRIHRIELATTKPAAALVRDWMNDELRARLRASDPTSGPVECFRGTVGEAVEKFPESLNVAASLALAAGDDRIVEVVVAGSPTATTNRHDISVVGDAGTYRFSVANRPAPDNPRTSHITAWAVLRTLRSLASTRGLAFR